MQVNRKKCTKSVQTYPQIGTTKVLKLLNKIWSCSESLIEDFILNLSNLSWSVLKLTPNQYGLIQLADKTNKYPK